MKICNKCKIEKPKSEFGRDKDRKDGLKSWCKPCKNTATKKYRETPKGKELKRKIRKAYYTTPRGIKGHRRAVQKYQKTPAGKESYRKARLKREYGMTIEDYDNMLKNQGGCGICDTKVPGGSGRFHIDHDHNTGEIRGLLCTNCNTMLGLSKDSINTLLKATQYLATYLTAK